ncbi:hypothetical protein [Escherichia coli]
MSSLFQDCGGVLRRCIVTGRPENKRDLDDITFDFFGEAHDALNDKNISVFRTGIERLTDTYTSIKRSYNYEVDKNYLDEVKESGLSILSAIHSIMN